MYVDCWRWSCWIRFVVEPYPWSSSHQLNLRFFCSRLSTLKTHTLQLDNLPRAISKDITKLLSLTQCTQPQTTISLTINSQCHIVIFLQLVIIINQHKYIVYPLTHIYLLVNQPLLATKLVYLHLVLITEHLAFNPRIIVVTSFLERK